MKKKVTALALGCAMTLGCAIGGTLAWLTDTTGEVQNVFTTSDITVALTENTGREYKMIPGWTVDKDPWVTVEKGSEDCWVFIEVKEGGGEVTVDGKAYTFDDFIAYQIDENNWEQLKDNDGKNVADVYCAKYENRDDDDINIKILAGGEHEFNGVTYTWEANQVLTRPEITKEMMNGLTDTNYPTLTFKAYASQLMKDNETEFEPYEAWQNISNHGGSAHTQP